MGTEKRDLLVLEDGRKRGQGIFRCVALVVVVVVLVVVIGVVAICF